MLIWLIGKKGLLAQAFFSFFQEKKLPFFQTGQDKVDITHSSSIKKVLQQKRPTHIVNCAAFTDVDLAEQEEEKAFTLNAKAPTLLAKYSRALPAKLIHFSTDYVFDGKKKEFYGEEEEAAPINIYGKTKLEGEKGVQKENPTSLIIRTAWLFGLGKKGFFPHIYQKLQEKKELRIVQDKVGSPTFCKDLCEMVWLLQANSGIYHVVNKGGTTRYELAQFLLAFLKRKGKEEIGKVFPAASSEFQDRVERPLFSPLSTQKLEKTLSITTRPWQQALEEYLTQETFYESNFLKR